MRVSSKLVTLGLGVLLLASNQAFADEDIFVEGEYSPITDTQQTEDALLLNYDQIHNLELSFGELGLNERQRYASLDQDGAMPIGIHREPPPSLDSNLAQQLSWQSGINGDWVGTFTISAPHAESLRLQLSVSSSETVQLLFFDLAGSEAALVDLMLVHAQSAVDEFIKDDLKVRKTTTFWSPSVEGSIIGVEVRVPSQQGIDDTKLVIEKLAHRVDSPGSQQNGVNACSFEQATCLAEGSQSHIGDSMVRISFEDADSTQVCAATLINDSAAGYAPYLLTAAHCVSSNSIAETLEAHWNLQSSLCTTNVNDGRETSIYGGAVVVETDPQHDMTLLKLNRNAPVGVYYTGWTTSEQAVEPGVALVGFHHGYHRGISQGAAQPATCSENRMNCAKDADLMRVDYHTGFSHSDASGFGLFIGSSLVAMHTSRPTNETCASTGYAVPIRSFADQLKAHLLSDSDLSANEKPRLASGAQSQSNEATTQDDHGDTRGDATLVASTSQTDAAIDSSGDEDYFQFVLEDKSAITITTTGSTDTVCQLEPPEGEFISNDDGGEGRNCLIETTGNHGTYYLKVRGYADATGSYSLSINTKSQDISDDQDSPYAYTIGSPHMSRIGRPRDLDFYSFEIQEPGTVHIFSRGESDIVGCVWDETSDEEKQRWVCDDDSGEDRNFKLTLSLTTPATYVLRVAGFEDMVGDYTISILFTAEGDVGDQFSSAANIKFTTPNWEYQTQNAIHSADFDYYRIEIEQPIQFIAYSTGSANTRATMFSDSALTEPIADEQEGGEGSNFKVETELASGTYYFVIESIDDSEPVDYTFHISAVVLSDSS